MAWLLILPGGYPHAITGKDVPWTSKPGGILTSEPLSTRVISTARRSPVGWCLDDGQRPLRQALVHFCASSGNA
jgi:hypothetical protein